MSARTSTVGGGAATGVANDFNSFLQQQLRGANTAAASNAQQPQQQSQSAFGNIFNQMAGGQTPDQSGAQGQLSQFFANQGSALPTFQNPYQNQQYNAPQFSQLGTNFGAGQTGMANLSGFGNVGPTNFNTAAGMGAQGSSPFSAQLAQMFGQGQGMLNRGMPNTGVASQQVALDAPAQIDLNSPTIQAQQAIADRTLRMAQADNNARFGAAGAGALGTGAQFANSNLQAAAAPQIALALQQSIQQQQAADLAQRQAKAGVGLQNAGNDLQGQIASMQGGLQGNAQQQNLFNSMMSGALTGQGQDFQNQLGNRQADISQLGLGLNQAQGNQNAALTQQQQMMQSLLQNQGLGNQFGLNAFNANSANQQTNNANSLAGANAQNGFNLQNAGNMAQYGQGANQLNLQSALGGQGNLLQAIQMGMQQNQFGAGQQANLLAQLFGGMQQSNQLGTPQSQNVTTPNPWMQGLQGALGIGGQLLGGGLGGLFGRGGTPTPSLPGMPNFGSFQPTTTWGGSPYPVSR